ncbi:MAG: subclass B1 metallo-beta-lactamase [Cytophagaceae bacterium]|nr:metallo-beta-lactamase [uncultured bacterium]MBK6977402.1 subclass B1 metallo-beta-lactamase [Cytophagaceae bacterium]MBK9509805.1 subclass B1 metallo-beta-lactamase [Cytophagaceae bacterium]MBK9933309.1 subclass B1 metallo-beta-lactamase [Cytophagaceae bacterium]MBL0302975.1 subclass B1 metallo-beta-lactamase [Cytophagaceae bacterium]
MRTILNFCILFSIHFLGNAQTKLVSGNEDLIKFSEIKPNVFVHETYLNTQTWGKVGCNGLVYINGKEAVIFDTPTDSISTEELFKSLDKAGIKVKAVVVNHFHNDCLGGLKEFHKRNIPSYASNKTLELAKKDNVEIPKNGFDKEAKIKIGKKTVINYHPGGAHTHDNIVSYIPSEKVMFGGCMVKEMEAGKGFLGDADVKAWPQTIEKVKAKFPNVEYVIPGHGQYGGKELFEYTIKLFSEK